MMVSCLFHTFLLTVALGKSEDSLQAAIAAASTPSSVSSPSFSMGWSPYLWPASIGDLSMFSKYMSETRGSIKIVLIL